MEIAALDISEFMGKDDCMNYDGVMFGNGMSLNLLQQLKPLVPKDKQYLLDVNEFLKSWIEGKISQREERIFYTSLYGNKKDRRKFFGLLKENVTSYYGTYDADIEYTLGMLLFKESEHKDMIRLFPAIYNIWHIILCDYLKYLNLGSNIAKFYESVVYILGNPRYRWTTNFDLFGESINPEHIHGRFLIKMKAYEDVIYKKINNGANYYFKYIWGHNGNGKSNNIQQLTKYGDYMDFFDFDFFYNDFIRMDKMLIYGMGFKKSGFTVDLRVAYPKYNKAVSGAIIDEHVLERIKVLQDLKMLNQVDITYFNNEEERHLEEVMEAVAIKKYDLIKCRDFAFSTS